MPVTSRHTHSKAANECCTAPVTSGVGLLDKSLIASFISVLDVANFRSSKILTISDNAISKNKYS